MMLVHLLTLVNGILAGITTQIPSTGQPPIARTWHSIAYSPSYLVVFGCWDSKIFYNDVWLFNFSSNFWTELYPLSDQSPSNFYLGARAYPAIFFNENHQILYLYGGISANGPQFDLWSFNINARAWQFINYVTDFNPLDSFSYNTYTRNNIQYLCIFGGININDLSNSLYM